MAILYRLCGVKWITCVRGQKIFLRYVHNCIVVVFIILTGYIPSYHGGWVCVCLSVCMCVSVCACMHACMGTCKWAHMFCEIVALTDIVVYVVNVWSKYH